MKLFLVRLPIVFFDAHTLNAHTHAFIQKKKVISAGLGRRRRKRKACMKNFLDQKKGSKRQET